MFDIRLKSALLIALAILLVPTLSHAEEWVQFDSVQFTIDGERPLQALEEALQDLPKLSKAFRPDGARISDLSVRTQGPKGVPRVAFEASRGIGFVRHSAVVRADIETAEDGEYCRRHPGSRGYRIQVNTEDSDQLVAANVSTFVVTLCVREINGGRDLDVLAAGRMKKGYDYGRFAGPAIRNMIEAQTDPLITALLDVVNFYQR